jgi:hypothetical protein
VVIVAGCVMVVVMVVLFSSPGNVTVVGIVMVVLLSSPGNVTVVGIVMVVLLSSPGSVTVVGIVTVVSSLGSVTVVGIVTVVLLSSPGKVTVVGSVTVVISPAPGTVMVVCCVTVTISPLVTVMTEVTAAADSVMVTAEQVLGARDMAELEGTSEEEKMPLDDGAVVDELGLDEEARTLVDKVVRAAELETTCPLQVPNSLWHFFATSQ